MILAPLAHRLIHWRYDITSESVLNSGPPPSNTPSPLAVELKMAVNAMKTQAFDVERGRVDYAALRDSAAYADYCLCSRRLQSFDPLQLRTHEERLAFWINLYNALIVDAVIAFGVKRSVTEVPGFFWKAAYCIGGHRFCTFDVENGVLRANAGHPAIPGPHFGPSDPRRAYSLPVCDPRIHFALVCAARSCPPIAVYDADNIAGQLESAARTFVNGGGAEVDVVRGEARLSSIFQWYAPDFGGPSLGWGDMRLVLRRLSRWVADESAIQRLAAGDLKIKYLPYDWALNA
ncbi:MAG: DUF547 domain-containing protein [Chloroflexi bacterium]|nr:DUF547 domain-containing protein [Chloroflexota bacterium]